MPCTKYQYRCLRCSQTYPGNTAHQSFRLHCDSCGERALLEAEYPINHSRREFNSASPSAAWKALDFDTKDPSFFRYRNWLPVHRTFAHAALPHLRPSKAFSRLLGLSDLDLLFSGYAPEMGSDIRSTTFKEFEAYSVFAYTTGACSADKILVVASAGNTARAFAEVALREQLPVLLVLPDISLHQMQLSLPIKADSKVVFIASTHKYSDKPSEYADAIQLSKILCDSAYFFSEGGVKNIARRDGLGVGYLHAQFSRTSAHPTAAPYRYYFQAIGSGTGAIGSYSMYQRLKRVGCIPQQHQLSLMLAQNAPFIPVIEHWCKRCTTFQPYERQESLRRNNEIAAPVLANRNPPYAVIGGLADLLQRSNGDAFAVSNDEIFQMQEFFAQEEGLDILPAAAVAAAALKQAAATNRIDKEQPILLHLTGGGESQLQHDFPQRYAVQAAHTVDLADLEDSDEKRVQLIRQVEQHFGFS